MSPEIDPERGADVTAQKRALRARVRAARRSRCAAPDAEARRSTQAARLADALLAHPACRARCVAVFESLPTEPPVGAATTALLARGARVLVPHLRGDLDLDWRELEGRDSGYVPGPLLGREAIGAAGLVLVPALAVDRRGARLGQGGGSYDRALVRRDPCAVVCGVVHDDEFRPDPVPHDAHDVPLDAVLTASGGWTALPTHPLTWDDRSG